MKNNQYRYIGKCSGKKIRYLAIMILKAYYNDELILIIIHGKQGYGKSTFAGLILAQVYGIVNLINKIIKDNPELIENKDEKEKRHIYLQILNKIIDDDEVFTFDWDTTKKYFVFTPRQFILLSGQQRKKAPCCIIDDAGLWLNAMDFNSPAVKATGKILEVARTIWGAIIFTCSDQNQVFSKLRNMPHIYTVRITKHTDKGKYKDRRMATIFKGWISEDLRKSGRKTQAIDMFYAEMPGDIDKPNTFYGWYKPERMKLTQTGFKELEKALDDLGIF